MVQEAPLVYKGSNRPAPYVENLRDYMFLCLGFVDAS